MKKNLICFYFFIILSPSLSYSQIERKGNFLSFMDSLFAAMPSGIGTNEYVALTSTQRLLFGVTVEHCLKKKYSDAVLSSGYFGYNVLAFTDTISVPNRLYFILLRSQDSSNHWGTFVFNPDPRRSTLVIQSPHELYDTKTGAQGAYVFQELSARAYFANGTHRCNNSASSACSGTTTACGGTSAPFKISDQAHNDDGSFQLGTLVLMQQQSDAVVVQLHGFGKGTGDPDLIMGNGTNSVPTGTDYLLLLKNALFSIDTSLTCKIAHIDTSWTELTGTTNTQGRLLNNSDNPCTAKATSATGNFLHIEQAYAKLRDSKSHWEKVSDALAIVFPADPVSVSDQKETSIIEFVLNNNYPNPFNPATTISFTIKNLGFITLKVYDALGREVSILVNEVKPAGSYTVQFDAAALPSGIYIARISVGALSVAKKMILLK